MLAPAGKFQMQTQTQEGHLCERGGVGYCFWHLLAENKAQLGWEVHLSVQEFCCGESSSPFCCGYTSIPEALGVCSI